MNRLSFATALAAAGGAVSPEALPPAISEGAFDTVAGGLAFAAEAFEETARRYRRDSKVVIALTNSTAIGCEVREVEEGFLAVFVPLGVPARFQALARLLLGYWGRERKVHVVQSPLDDIPWDRRAIPARLQPVFLSDLSEGEIWRGLAELAKETPPDWPFAPDVQELLHLALVFLVGHEFTHVLHGHPETLRRAQRLDLGMTRDELLRACEVDADDGAAAIAMLFLQRGVEAAQARGREDRMDLGWLRLGYAVTMLFGLADAHRRSLRDFDSGRYNHPIVRCELFAPAVDRCLDAPDSVRELVHANLNEGWMRCVWAFNDLTLDVMTGKHGALPKDVTPRPIHNLAYGVYGGPTQEAISDRLREAATARARLRRLLPGFDAGDAGPKGGS